jgi:hypothetical protein
MNDSGVNVPTSLDFNNGTIYRVHLTYDGTRLIQTITSLANPSATFLHEYSVNISAVIGGSHAYAGFTGGTGEAYAKQEIFNWIMQKPSIGDLNVDGAVSIADFLTLASNFGKPNTMWGDGDVNGDGVVTIADFLALASNFGAMPTAALMAPASSAELTANLGSATEEILEKNRTHDVVQPKRASASKWTPHRHSHHRRHEPKPRLKWQSRAGS